MELRDFFEEIYEQFESLKNTVGILFDSGSIKEFFMNIDLLYKFAHQCAILIYLVIQRAENFLTEDEVQKEFAKFLDEKIKMPMVLELFDDKIFYWFMKFASQSVKIYFLNNREAFSGENYASVADVIAKNMQVA